MENKVNTESQDLESVQEKIEDLEKTISEIDKELARIKAVASRLNQRVLAAVGGFTLLINGTEKGSYSRLNFIEGTNISLVLTENREEGRVNIRINSQGGGGTSLDAIIYSIALG